MKARKVLSTLLDKALIWVKDLVKEGIVVKTVEMTETDTESEDWRLAGSVADLN